MSMKPNYFKIGLFVIIAFILIIASIVVFGSGLFEHEKIYLETYFDGSVSGLNIGAPVEVRGVRIGEVSKITFAGNEYDIPMDSEEYYKQGSYVMVIVAVNPKIFPENFNASQRKELISQFISRGFRVRLATNLLTGIAYLQGEYVDPNRYPVLGVPWEPKRCYVSSAPGEFTTMKQSLDSILNKLEQIDSAKIASLAEQLLYSFNETINDVNVPEISGDIRNLLAKTDKMINDANIAKISNDIQTFIASADKAVNDINTPVISSEIQNLLIEVRQTNTHLQQLLKNPENLESQETNIAVLVANLNKTLAHIDKLIVNESAKIDQTIENLRATSDGLKDLTIELKQYPSQIIFNQPPPKTEIPK